MRALGVVNSLQNCYVSSERQIGVADAVRDAVRAAIIRPALGLYLDLAAWSEAMTP